MINYTSGPTKINVVGPMNSEELRSQSITTGMLELHDKIKVP